MKIHFALFILLLLVSSCKKNNTSIPLVDSVEVEEQYEDDCDKCNGKGFVFVNCDYCAAQVNYCLQLQEPSQKSVTNVRELGLSNAKNVMALPVALNATELGLLHVHHVMALVVII